MRLNKRIYSAMVASVLLMGGVAFAANRPISAANEPAPVLVTLDQHSNELANHEARLTNVENDVQAVQKQTGSTPSTTRVEVPVPQAAAPQTVAQPTTPPSSNPTPQPDPITVKTSVRKTIISATSPDSKTTCEYTYTDGTSNTVEVGQNELCKPEGSLK